MIRLHIGLKSFAATVLSLAFFVCPSNTAFGQETTGSISGTVRDASGAVIKGATVTITNTDRDAVERTMTTSSAGTYTAVSLPLGNYSVKVVDAGFKTEDVTGVVLHVNDALTINRTLVPGNESEIVSVSADRAQIDLEDATSAGLINGAQIKELPLSFRNYELLMQLQPGVSFGGASDQLYVGPATPSGSSNQVNFSVNGGRNTSNNWTIDGADNVDRGANLTLLTFPSVDAIAEFKTLRGQYTAEFGRNASGQINVVTRSGTNNIHGTVYEFFRNDVLNANTWGDKLVTPFTARPKLRYNDFGGTVAGPVYIPHVYNGHDKTFFFFSEEARRLIQYVPGTALVPTDYERTGDFSNAYYLVPGSTTNYARGPVTVCTAYGAGGACTAFGTKVASIDPTAAAYIKDVFSVIPLPPSAADVNAGLDPHTLTSNVPNILNDNQILARVDHAVGSKLNVFYRYIHDSFPTSAGGGTFNATPIPNVSNTITDAPSTQHLGHGTYVFSPTLLMDIGYAYSNNRLLTTPVGVFTSAGAPDVRPNLPYANLLGVIPTISLTGLTGLGSTGIYHDNDTNHNAFGNVTKVMGRNTVIVGATYDHYQKLENKVGGNQGAFTFTTGTPTAPTIAGNNTALSADLSTANFLLGNASNFTQNSTAITANVQENVLEAYVQDNWRITPRLTLNLGVRYSYFAQPTEGGGRANNFDPTTYSAARAPTITSTGLVCLVAPCANADGLNSGVPNGSADYVGNNYINGLIFGTPSAANNNQASAYGNKIGAAQKNNLAPRFGFAYDVFGDGHTSFRGGYGWAFEESEVSFYENEDFSNPPAVAPYSNAPASFSSPTSGTLSTAINTSPGEIYATPTHYQTPYIQQYSLDVQQELTSSFLLDIGYFGTHGTHLLGLENIDEAVPGAYVGKLSPLDIASTCTLTEPNTTVAIPAFTSSTCERGLNQIRPYLGYNDIEAVRSIFSSNYNSLQVKATKRFSGQSLIDVNYTWSRDLTNAPSDYSTPPQNIYNVNGDYGRATDDRTNVLAIDYIFELPWFKSQKGLVGHLVGGWETTGIFALNSGLPLTVTESAALTINYGETSPYNGQNNGGVVSDASGIGILGTTLTSLRPNMVSDPNSGNGIAIHNKFQWFNRTAFVTPTPQSAAVGNEKRSVINGPGFNRLDVGLFRNFKIHEGLAFQFRAEAYNVANHTNFQGIGTAATSTNFGQVTSARDNRIMQLAGKINF